MNRKLLPLALLPFIGVAFAQPQPPPGGGLGASSGVATLYAFGSSAGNGNGADTTEDTLLTFNIPAGTLKAVGDRIKIFANGTFAASTDTKVARVRLNGASAFQGANGATATTTVWNIYIEVQKVAVGANSQVAASYAIVNNGAIASSMAGGVSLNDPAIIVLTITGQNSTTATANSIVVKYLAVEYLP